ncbi:MAG: hypothetical protein SCALA701_33890 [Candidatus Scalindua sp.]|nr:MAG: hypothetical protein SCALA701_33890 [Candidatus Scalindua sp.]
MSAFFLYKTENQTDFSIYETNDAETILHEGNSQWSQQTVRKFVALLNNGAIEWDRDKCSICTRCSLIWTCPCSSYS